MKSVELAIDERLCWGCKTCEVACKQEHRTSPGVKLIRVDEEGPHLVDGKLKFEYRVSRCRHCDEPPCAAVCPVDALTKRDEGVVILDAEVCIGCGACVDACPFDAVEMDEGEKVAVKCNLCHERIDKGLLPACADNVCLAHCISLKVTGGE